MISRVYFAEVYAELGYYCLPPNVLRAGAKNILSRQWHSEKYSSRGAADNISTGGISWSFLGFQTHSIDSTFVGSMASSLRQRSPDALRLLRVCSSSEKWIWTKPNLGHEVSQLIMSPQKIQTLYQYHWKKASIVQRIILNLSKFLFSIVGIKALSRETL